MDETKLNEFVGQMLGDLGGAFSVPLVRIGDRLGLYRALMQTARQRRTNWREGGHRRTLCTGVAVPSGRVRLSDLRPGSGKFTLPPEQAMVFAQPDSPVYMQGGFDLAAVDDGEPGAGRAGVPHRQGRRLGRAVAVPVLRHRRFFRPGYHNSLVESWLPALDGMMAKLERGATVADVGCGHGFSTVIMAKAFPNSTFVGYDFHPGSVEQARAHAEQHGVTATRDSRSPRQRLSRQGP